MNLRDTVLGFSRQRIAGALRSDVLRNAVIAEHRRVHKADALAYARHVQAMGRATRIGAPEAWQ